MLPLTYEVTAEQTLQHDASVLTCGHCLWQSTGMQSIMLAPLTVMPSSTM